MRYTRPFTIRFRHCDPAGIVFYPRYFEMINDLFEDWFAHLGQPFDRMHGTNALGVPTVSLQADFLHPCRLGETLELSLAVEHLGRSSFELTYVFTHQSEVRARAKAVVVFVSREGEMRSVPIPPEVRERMLPFLVASGETV
jgi:4-hydroxybenzoyl-CoA thioesterase